jgi:hypothetical protein
MFVLRALKRIIICLLIVAFVISVCLLLFGTDIFGVMYRAIDFARDFLVRVEEWLDGFGGIISKITGK